jgi:hypothetical protein
MAVVDDFRRALVSLLELGGEIEAHDLRAFARCLVRSGSRPSTEIALEPLLGSAHRVVAQLGAMGDIGEPFELMAYEVPLVEGDGGDGSPGP